MVTNRYLDRRLVEPVRERLREEGREEVRRQRREQAIAIGEKQERQRWTAWNQRRMEAEARGEAFDEPPPDNETIFKNVEYY